MICKSNYVQPHCETGEKRSYSYDHLDTKKVQIELAITQNYSPCTHMLLCDAY